MEYVPFLIGMICGMLLAARLIKTENANPAPIANDEHERLKKALSRLNGSNVIVENQEEEILVGRSKYGTKLFMLPGGGIERGELPKHAGAAEAEEETNVVIEEKNLTLIGYFIQRIKYVESASGVLFLYWTTIYSDAEIASETEEFTDIQFMSFDEIMERKDEFGTGYLRAIVWWKRRKDGIDTEPVEKRLSDKVDYIHNGKFISI